MRENKKHLQKSHKNKHGTECALERRHDKINNSEQNNLFYPLIKKYHFILLN